MRAMGLDVGTKTIGVAVADELGWSAQGLPTIRRESTKLDLAALQVIVTEYGITEAVVGLPLNMNGSEGPRAEAIRRFGGYLEETLKLIVHYQDERLTTVEAQRTLLEGDVSRSKRKQVVDQVAATLILQTWLDSRKLASAE